jgi:hypothetical protein
MAALERLNDEIRHDAAVVRVHARAVSIEDPCHLYPQLVLSIIVKEKRLSATTFTFVA